MVNWKLIALSSVGVFIIVFLIYFLNFQNDVDYSVSSESFEECENIMFSGTPDSKIDILFIPNNYEDSEKFLNDVKLFRDTFFSLVPFKDNEERFNFFILNDFDEELDCTYDEAILCDPKTVKRVASRCVYDYVFVVTDVNGITNLFERLRSSAWQGTASLNPEDLPYVFPHEFGHLFSYLADEYIVPGAKMTWNAPNCVADESCERFKEIEGTECYQGCMLATYYREPYNGIMKDYYSSNGRTYGLYNEYILEQDMLSMSDVEISTSPNYSPEPIYFIDAEYDNGKINVTNIEEGFGFAPSLDKGYSFVVGENEIKISVPNIIFTDGERGGDVEVLDKVDFTFSVPADEVGDANFGKFLDDEGEEIGTVTFNDDIISYPISKEIILGIIPFYSE